MSFTISTSLNGYFGVLQASEGEREASEERETPLSCRVCLSLLHVRFERRSPEKQKKHSACSAGYTI